MWGQGLLGGVVEGSGGRVFAAQCLMLRIRYGAAGDGSRARVLWQDVVCCCEVMLLVHACVLERMRAAAPFYLRVSKLYCVSLSHIACAFRLRDSTRRAAAGVQEDHLRQAAVAAAWGRALRGWVQGSGLCLIKKGRIKGCGLGVSIAVWPAAT